MNTTRFFDSSVEEIVNSDLMHKFQTNFSKSLESSSSSSLSINNHCHNQQINSTVDNQSDLNTPEVSFDIQRYIESEIESVRHQETIVPQPNNVPLNPEDKDRLNLEDSTSIFTDLINEVKYGTNRIHHNLRECPENSLPNYNSNYLPSNQMIHKEDRLQQVTQSDNCIKQEPSEDQIDYSSTCSQGSYSPGPNMAYSDYDAERGHGVSSHPSVSGASPNYGKSSLKHSKKNVDKGSDEYKRRRERNNLAVRKSREKAKQRSRDTEKKVSELQRDNEVLRKKIDMLNKELAILKTLLANVGVHPESVENEIAQNLDVSHHHLEYN